MAGQQSIHENGRVTALFKSAMAIATGLILAGILAIFTVAWQLNNSIADLEGSISLLNNNYQHSQNEHAIFRAIHQDLRNDINNVAGRVSDLERAERRGDGNNN